MIIIKIIIILMSVASAKSKLNNQTSSTISLSDFMRIRNTIAPPLNDEDERKAFDATLKASSLQKTRNWPDSIEMAKKNKLESRKKVFFEKEMEKRKIDEEERRFQEMQKKLVIEKANKSLFEAQDSVKSFHSKLLFADVLKEREFQKEISERKKVIEVEKEARWIAIEHENMKEYDLKEIAKAELEKKKRFDQMNIINHQFNDFKIKKVKEYQDRVIEGEIIKINAKKALEEEKKKEEERKQKAIDQQFEFKKANDALNKLKEEIREKEKIEEKKVEDYAIKKNQMSDLRKRKEEEKFREKQQIRQKLIDNQIAYLKSLKNKENEILEKQVKEAEVKKENERQEKLKRFNELKMQIEIDRNNQMSRKQKLKEQAIKDDKDFIENWKEKMLLLEEAEREELREIRDRNKNLQNYHKGQIDVKRQKNEDKFVKENEDAYKTLLMLNNEQDDFLNYAEYCVKEYQAQGKDITPLIIELRNYKKKLFQG